MHSNKEIQIIKDLQGEAPDAMANVYHEYHSRFTNWARKQFPSFEKDTIENIYHDSLIVLIEDFIQTKRIGIENNKIIGLTTRVFNFLVSIGRNKLNNELRNNNRLPFVPLDSTTHDLMDENPSDEEKKINLNLVKKAYEELSDKAKDLIYYKYVLGYSYEEIKEVMDEKSANSLRTLCKRHMDKFRSIYWKYKNKQPH